jgi:hypothetical protein
MHAFSRFLASGGGHRYRFSPRATDVVPRALRPQARISVGHQRSKQFPLHLMPVPAVAETRKKLGGPRAHVVEGLHPLPVNFSYRTKSAGSASASDQTQHRTLRPRARVRIKRLSEAQPSSCCFLKLLASYFLLLTGAPHPLPDPLFPGVLVGPPPVRKCHHMSPKEHMQLGWVVRWVLGP